MRNRFLIILLSCTIFSCNYRIYSDDKKSVQIHQENKNWKSSDTSCLVFHLVDSLPDSTEYINTIKIQSPFYWANSASPNNVMTELAKTQASKLGGNVIKVVDYGGLIYTITIKVYHLKKSLWSEYKNKRDSTERANQIEDKNLCIIHIRTFCWIQRPLYFNDSLIGKFYATTKNMRSSKSQVLDFKLAFAGKLTTALKKKHKIPPGGLELKTGKEYYIWLDNYGASLRMVSKEDYY